MIERIHDFIREPRLVTSGTTGILGLVTMEHLQGLLSLVGAFAAIGSAFLVATQIHAWFVHRFVCPKHDASGDGCSGCRLLGTWQCPDRHRRRKRKLVENQYD